MGQPARKLSRHAASRRREMSTRRGAARVIPLPKRRAPTKDGDTWVLDQIMRWYQSRAD